ncbi:MAG: hypothetical protein RR914_00455 [Oscillospiraceae bacterium]
MKKSVICTITFLFTAIISWFLLSYFFFPIKFSALPLEYFRATMTHLMAFKFIVTLVFCLASAFVVDLKFEKSFKMTSDKIEKD